MARPPRFSTLAFESNSTAQFWDRHLALPTAFSGSVSPEKHLEAAEAIQAGREFISSARPSSDRGP